MTDERKSSLVALFRRGLPWIFRESFADLLRCMAKLHFLDWWPPGGPPHVVATCGLPIW